MSLRIIIARGKREKFVKINKVQNNAKYWIR